MAKKKKELLFVITVILILLISFLRIALTIMNGDASCGDHKWIWTECRYAFLHVSPYEAFKNENALPGLRTYPHISSMPWGLTLSTILQGGFFENYGYALIWYNIIRAAIIVLSVLTLIQKMQKEGYERQWIFIAVLLLFAPWQIISGVITANVGALICYMILLALLIMDEHPYYACVLLTFSMNKPQIAVPFFAVFLFMKKWKLITIPVISVLCAWGLSAIWTHTNPIKQLSGVTGFASQMEEDYHVVGILNDLRMIGVPSQTALLLSMFVGLAILLLMILVLLKRKPFNILSSDFSSLVKLYFIPALVSIMWCYKSECDYMIMILAGLAIMVLWLESNVGHVWLWIALCSLYTKPFSSFLLGRLPFMSPHLCNRFDLYLKTIALVVIFTFVCFQRYAVRSSE